MNVARFIPLALVAVAACSGGGGSQNAVPASQVGQKHTSAQTAQATIEIVVPLAGRTAAGAARKPQYVSPNTASFGVTLTSDNGTVVPIAQQTTQHIDVTPTSPNCTNSAGSLTCTATIDVPIGNDVFSVVAYGGGNASGAILSQNQMVTATIAPTAANVIPMTLDAVAANVTVTTGQVNGDLSTQPTPGTALSYPIMVTAKDCSGATIVGPGSYVTPITLTLHEVPANLSSTSLSETTVKGPGDVVDFNWTGSASTQYATITPTQMAPCGNIASSATPGYFLPRPTGPYLWAADSGGFHSANLGTSLVGYPLAWLHDVGNGSANEVARPGVEIYAADAVILNVAVDHAGNVYAPVNRRGPTPNGQGSYFPSIFQYAPGSTGAAAPTLTIPSSVLQPANVDPNNPAGIEDIAVDPSGNIFAQRTLYTTQGAQSESNKDILQLSAASGYSSASVFYHDQQNNTLNSDGNSLTVDASDNVFVINQVQNSQAGAVPALLLELGTGGASNYQGFGLGHDANGNFSAFGLTPDGAGNVLVATLPSYTGDPRQVGDPNVTPYSYAAIRSGSGTPGAPSFSAPGALSATGGYANGLARDAQGYLYLADEHGFVAIFAPGTSGPSAKAIGSLQNGVDPTTSDGRMITPAGIPPPGIPGGLAGIAAQN